jgi:hypothetical protein
MKPFELLNFSRTGGFALCCVNDDSQFGRAIYGRRSGAGLQETIIVTQQHMKITSFEVERDGIIPFDKSPSADDSHRALLRTAKARKAGASLVRSQAALSPPWPREFVVTLMSKCRVLDRNK